MIRLEKIKQKIEEEVIFNKTAEVLADSDLINILNDEEAEKVAEVIRSVLKEFVQEKGRKVVEEKCKKIGFSVQCTATIDKPLRYQKRYQIAKYGYNFESLSKKPQEITEPGQEEYFDVIMNIMLEVKAKENKAEIRISFNVYSENPYLHEHRHYPKLYTISAINEGMTYDPHKGWLYHDF